MNRCSKIISIIICFVLLVSQLSLVESLALDTDSLQADIQEEPETTEESQDTENDPTVVEAEPEDGQAVNEQFDGLEEETDTAEFVVEETAPDISQDSDRNQTFPEIVEEEKTEEDRTVEAEIDGIRILVFAEAGIFPEGWTLSVSSAASGVRKQAEEAIDKIREEDRKVAETYTFDIKVLDSDGNEVQPAEGKTVKVTFIAPENRDSNVEANVYHLKDGSGKKNAHSFVAEELVAIDGEGSTVMTEAGEVSWDDEEAITVETDGFSYYTVEFTYGNLQYVMQGGTTVALSEILDEVGLTGEITNAVTEDAPIEITTEEGEWYVSAYEAFTTTHTLKVTVKEITYDIELGYQELEKTYDLVVTDSIPVTRTITITKEWVNDDETARPDNVEVHLARSYSTLMTGPNLTMKMRELSGYPVSTPRTDNTSITGIVKATDSEYNAVRGTLTSANEVQISGEKTYMWFSGGKIYYYSQADNIYLNANSQCICSKMLNLTDISGMAGFNTTYVTDMAFMFEDCVSLVDLSPLAGWDTGNVTSMRLMLGANVTDSSHDHMLYSDLSALENWNTQSVTDMGMMFKAAHSVSSVEPLKNWNVSNLANVSQMFFRMYNLKDATCLKIWNVVRVGGSYINAGNGSTATGSFSQMFGRSGDPTGATCKTSLPKFTNRAGSWSTSAGTYNASTAAASGSAAVNAKIRDASDEYITSSSSWTKNESTWTATFTVCNDGSSWRVWEATNGGYIDGAHGETNAYIESSGGVNGYGGSSTNPITGVTDSATITNSNLIKKELAVTVEWSDTNDLYRDRPVFNNTTGPGGVHLTLSYGTQSKNSNSDVTKWVDNGNNSWTYTFTVYSNADISTYTVSEHAVPNYTQVGTPHITVTSSPGALIQTGTTTITNRHSIEILDRHSLIIASTASGNQASRDKYFKVDIEITNGGISTDLAVDYDEADETIPAYPNEATTVITSAVTQPASIETSVLGRASATFYLKSGQYIEINNMIEGTRYTVTITGEDYEISSVITGRDTDQTKPSDNVVSDTSTGIRATTEIVFINTRHGVIPSGVDVGKVEGIAISVIAIIGLITMAIKKRKGGADYE